VVAPHGVDAPGPEVHGACQAARERAVEVILVGDEARLREELERDEAAHARTYRGKVTLHHASEVIAMEDHPGSAFKSKKDSSMRVAFDMVASGEGDAVVSAGNSGAMLACGLFLMKRVAGLERPGIAGLCPTKDGSFCVVLDMGANTDPKPSTLAQFGVLGAVYARKMLGKLRPRVAVLSNGEEQTKGTPLTREAHRLLAASAGDDFEFAGYAEGRDFWGGGLDVVVTDGFTGNIALKTYEGAVRACFEILEQEVRKSAAMKLAALALKPALRAVKRRLEPDEVGGAVLLGLDGVAVISHGRSSGKAMKNAIVGAERLLEARILEELTAALARQRRAWEPAAASEAEG
jgi:glycerol-3-phosphate acyltransferase PlsX